MKLTNEIKFPIDMYGWVILRKFGKTLIRATSIEKNKKRITDFDGHATDQAIAEGGVKIKPKLFDARQFVE